MLLPLGLPLFSPRGLHVFYLLFGTRCFVSCVLSDLRFYLLIEVELFLLHQFYELVHLGLVATDSPAHLLQVFLQSLLGVLRNRGLDGD